MSPWLELPSGVLVPEPTRPQGPPPENGPCVFFFRPKLLAIPEGFFEAPKYRRRNYVAREVRRQIWRIRESLREARIQAAERMGIEHTSPPWWRYHRLTRLQFRQMCRWAEADMASLVGRGHGA